MGTSKKKRATYTPEYRREAGHLVIDDTGRAIASVAREIGVGEQLLGRWVHAERARTVPVQAPRDGSHASPATRKQARCYVSGHL